MVAERVLSLLRERFDDEGEGGTCREPDMSVSVLTPPTSLALRRRARSLCSLKSFRSAPGEATASGNGGTTKLEGGNDDDSDWGPRHAAEAQPPVME